MTAREDSIQTTLPSKRCVLQNCTDVNWPAHSDGSLSMHILGYLSQQFAPKPWRRAISLRAPVWSRQSISDNFNTTGLLFTCQTDWAILRVPVAGWGRSSSPGWSWVADLAAHLPSSASAGRAVPGGVTPPWPARLQQAAPTGQHAQH